ncbi:dTDP-4-dehydrorhamnose reductase [Cellulomonas sp. P5_C6]
MRWLVTGAAGMLGSDVVDVLTARGEAVTTTDRRSLDVTDATAVEQATSGHDVIVNCAAWTAVDDAESREPEAFATNALAAGYLARAARIHGATLVHVSTDYVVEGAAPDPIPEDAVPHPLSAYGRTKLAGEWAVRAEAPGRHLILRTAWLYGAGGPCFPKTILRVARERGAIGVVDDQVGQPTWTRDVAVQAVDAVLAGVPSGTYHATSAGRASWYEFARAVVEAGGLDPQIVTATTSGTLDRPAKRPAWSVLDHAASTAAGLTPIGDWRDRWTQASAAVLGAG